MFKITIENQAQSETYRVVGNEFFETKSNEEIGEWLRDMYESGADYPKSWDIKNTKGETI